MVMSAAPSLKTHGQHSSYENAGEGVVGRGRPKRLMVNLSTDKPTAESDASCSTFSKRVPNIEELVRGHGDKAQ